MLSLPAHVLSPDLQFVLARLAARYTPNPKCQRHLMAATLLGITTDTAGLDECSIDMALARMMHKIAHATFYVEGHCDPTVSSEDTVPADPVHI